MAICKSISVLTAAVVLASLSACGIAPKVEAPATYDFGLPAQAATAEKRLPPITLLDVQSPAWLDSNLIYYRLLYADAQQPRPYANSRWIMPAAHLIETRLKQKMALTGTLLATGDTALAPVLRVELEEFSQGFDSPANSRVWVRLNATLLVNRQVIGANTFYQVQAAPTADAQGAVRGLREATDVALDALIAWLKQQPLP